MNITMILLDAQDQVVDVQSASEERPIDLPGSLMGVMIFLGCPWPP
jgi:hypothetical protein